jgi:hypothetical protein
MLKEKTQDGGDGLLPTEDGRVHDVTKIRH